MRVLFSAVVCILIGSKVLIAPAQETSTFMSTTDSTTLPNICKDLDPPVNESILPEETSVILTWSTEQRNATCFPSRITVECVALWEENVEGWQWVRNSSEIFAVDRNSNKTTVHVRNLTEFTNYTCRGFLFSDNNVSSLPTQIKFQTKQQVPSSPQNLTVTELTSTNFTVQWTVPEKNPGTFLTYHIHIESSGPEHFIPSICDIQTVNEWNSTTDEYYIFYSAFPHYLYYVTVFLENSAGNGTEASINITTNTAASEPPMNFTIYTPTLNIEANSLHHNISWNMPCNTNGEIEYFKIDLYGFYTPDSSFEDSKTYTINATNTDYFETAIDLLPSSDYTISIQANGINETGQFYNETFVTEDNFPSEPILENITEIASNYFILSWAEPQRRAGNITGYNMSIISGGPMYDVDLERCYIEPNRSWNVSLPSNKLMYIFTKGQPYYKYEVIVTAETSRGFGNPASIVAITKQSAPEKPDQLTAKLLNENTTGLISWNVPCNINGAINGSLIVIQDRYSEDEVSNVTIREFLPYENNMFTYYYNISLLESHIYEVDVWITLLDNTIGSPDTTTLITPDGYPGPPILTDISNVSSSFFTLYWSRPTKRNGRIVTYEVNINSEGPLYNTSCPIPKDQYIYNVTGDITYFTFEEALPYFNYSVLIVPATSRGWGDASITAFQATEVSIPDNVQEVSNRTSLPTQEEYNAYVNISVVPPCKVNGPLLRYNLTLIGSRVNHVTTMNTTSSNDNIFNFIPLQPEYTYEIQIETFNGKYSNTLNAGHFVAPAGIPQFSNPSIDVSLETRTSEASIILNKDAFDVRNGAIKYIAIILSETDETGGYFSEWDSSSWPNITRDGYYQLTSDWWYPFVEKDTVEFNIGNETSCNKNSCNKPLESGKDYYLIIRIFTNDFYKNSPTIHFRTEEKSKLGIILGIIFGLLAVAIAGFIAFFVWRKKLIRLRPLLYASRKPSVKPPVTCTTSIPINKYVQYYKNLENNPEKFSEQYMLLTEKSKEIMSTHTTAFAELNENRRKNRYTNILPYDATRVKLLIDEDDEIGSDYINASYIKGYSGEAEYIATQGPLPATCRDFWKMVIQENVSIIVMVTQFVEDGKEKCYKYFPNNHESMSIGDDMEIKCTMELHFGTYCVRTIQVKKDATQVTVTHMQYLDWPDFNVPNGTETMLQFCYQLRERLKIEGGYVIVHCSAGVGRTGTLIATDILIQNINAGKNIDIFNTVLDLRKQRMSMVQAQKQYVYIHRLIKDSLESHSLELTENLEPLYEDQSALQMKTDDDNLINKEKEVESQF